MGADGTWRVGFSRSAPEEALEYLENSETGYVIEEDVGFTETDIERDVTVISGLIAQAVGKSFIVDVGASPAEGSMTITVLGAATIPSEIEALRSQIQAATSLAVTYKTSEATPMLTGHGRAGGTWLDATSTAGGDCTTGFVAKRINSSDLGVITAGHCAVRDSNFNAINMHYYKPWGNHESYLMEPISTVFSGSGDAAFYRSPFMMDAWFHRDLAVGRPVSEVRNPRSGDLVCRFGMASALGSNEGYQCGSVLNPTTSLVYGGVSIQGMATIQNWSATGDSGGPNFTGNTALGITALTNSVNGQPVKSGPNEILWITRILWAQSAVGALVCKDPVCTW